MRHGAAETPSEHVGGRETLGRLFRETQRALGGGRKRAPWLLSTRAASLHPYSGRESLVHRESAVTDRAGHTTAKNPVMWA